MIWRRLRRFGCLLNAEHPTNQLSCPVRRSLPLRDPGVFCRRNFSDAPRHLDDLYPGATISIEVYVILGYWIIFPSDCMSAASDDFSRRFLLPDTFRLLL